MKYLRLLIALVITLPLCTHAQVSEGEIQFDETINLHKRIPPDREQFKDMIPEFRTFPKVLYFNTEASSWRSSEREIPGQEDPMEGGRGRRFRMRMSGAGGGMNSSVYTNLEEGYSIDQRDMFDKQFLVNGEPETFSWKVSPEQKQVLDYVCMKATFEDSSRKIVVWFTPQIPVSAGPGRLGGLPGMILEADYNDGERTVEAVSISTDTPDPSLLVAPKKGKKVTEEEFRAIREEKIKEFREMRGEGGRRVRIN
ncbi:MAG: GLPGLI family protein [Bacteroidota bacterium]